MGRKVYPKARSLLITADSGGSNGSRLRLWKWNSKNSPTTGLTLKVHHLPPGTSKWNKIEHRLISFISQHWRGKPLLTRAAVVNLIGTTRTGTGVGVGCVLNTGLYPPKISVSDQQMTSIELVPDDFHGDWNYAIKPRKQ